IRNLPCDAYGGRCQLPDPIGRVHTRNRQRNGMAKLRPNDRKDLYQKPDDRISIRAHLFMNGTHKKKTFSLAECLRGESRRYRMSNDLDIFDAVFLEFLALGFRHGNHDICDTSERDFFLEHFVRFVLRYGIGIQTSQREFTPCKKRFRVVDQSCFAKPILMSRKNEIENPHIVWSADEDRLVITVAIP